MGNQKKQSQPRDPATFIPKLINNMYAGNDYCRCFDQWRWWPSKCGKFIKLGFFGTRLNELLVDFRDVQIIEKFHEAEAGGGKLISFIGGRKVYSIIGTDGYVYLQIVDRNKIVISVHDTNGYSYQEIVDDDTEAAETAPSNKPKKEEAFVEEKQIIKTPVWALSDFADLVSGDKVKITGKKLKADQGEVIFKNVDILMVEFEKFNGGHDGSKFWEDPSYPEDKKIPGRENCWKFRRAGDEGFEVERLSFEYKPIEKPATENPQAEKPPEEKPKAGKAQAGKPKVGKLNPVKIGQGLAEDDKSLLIDQTGREIPAHLELTSRVCNENPAYHPDQPEIGYGEIRESFIDSFPKGTKFLSEAEFEDRAEKAKETILRDSSVANIFNRTHLPILFSQHVVSDMGDSLQDFYLQAAKSAYLKQFPERQFINHLDGKLSGKVSVIPNMGHDKFIAAMAEGAGMAWYFPDPMKGFSVLAQREAMKALMSHGFSLAGAIEPSLAMVGYSKYLARDRKTPKLDCSAVSFGSSAASLGFIADDDDLAFVNDVNLDGPNDICSGGLVLLG
jgi:hypothetical protein